MQTYVIVRVLSGGWVGLNPAHINRAKTSATDLKSKSRTDLIDLIEKERVEHLSSMNAISAQNQSLLKDKAQLELRLAQYQTQLQDYVAIRAKANDFEGRVKESLGLLQNE
eukprot:4404454-Pyramimonas_sp.AAC.2